MGILYEDAQAGTLQIWNNVTFGDIICKTGCFKYPFTGYSPAAAINACLNNTIANVVVYFLRGKNHALNMQSFD